MFLHLFTPTREGHVNKKFKNIMYVSERRYFRLKFRLLQYLQFINLVITQKVKIEKQRSVITHNISNINIVTAFDERRVHRTDGMNRRRSQRDYRKRRVTK